MADGTARRAVGSPAFWNRGVAFGLLAALLFGASTPAAKQLLGDVRPQLLAGLLYGGAALVLLATQPLHRRRAEAPLGRSDLPVLAVVVAPGGIIARSHHVDDSHHRHPHRGG